MDERERLTNGEVEGWREMLELVDRLTIDQIGQPGMNAEGWSVKDLLWHNRSWTEEAARQLGRVREGAYEELDWDTDDLNERHLAEGRALEVAVVRRESERSRSRVLAEWAWVTELSAPVVEWFGESGQDHYGDHAPELHAWVERLAPGRAPDLAARREAKLAAEDAAWEELNGLIGRLSAAQLEASGVTPDGWSAKDTMWHVACWSADCVRSLEQIRAGTFEGEWQDDDEIERMNRRWFEESRDLDLETVKAEWFSAHAKMVESFGTLESLTPQAEEWFDESSTVHYEKHLIDLKPWVPERLASG